MSAEQRLTDLEIRFAHQERTIEELSDMVAAQGRTIDLLTERVRRLVERVREVEAWRPSPSDDKPPPHY